MSTRSAVLGALREAGSAGVSGESLARELGVSRVAVGKHVAALRELGYEIDAEPGQGYALRSAPDLALPEEVEPLLDAHFWKRVEGGMETASTNSDAVSLARVGACEGTVVVAARQTGGRGRLGRSWSSPPGGAYVSAVLRPPVAPSEAGPLALVVGLGVARGLESLGVPARVKWPNDVVLAQDDGYAKLAGVLLEMSAEADRIDWVVAGFGINCTPPSPDAVTESDLLGAAFVSDVIPGVRAATVAAAVLGAVADAYKQWCSGGFQSLLSAYFERDVLGGTEVTVRDAMGGVRASGLCEGVDAEGRLLVRGEAGLITVSAGEVTLRRA